MYLIFFSSSSLFFMQYLKSRVLKKLIESGSSSYSSSIGIFLTIFIMDFEQYTKPILTEPGVKYFLSETLKQCKDFKDKYYNTLFNISLGFALLLIISIILIFKYKGKLTPAEKESKNREKQQYILTKIKNYQNAKQIAQQELITGLPQWDTEYDIVHRKIQ